MWFYVALFILGVQGLCALQLVSDMNEVLIETMGEALELSEDSSLSESSFTGAVTPPGKSSSHSETDHHHVPRGHRRNSIAHQSRSAKSGDIRCFCNMPQCVTTNYMCKADAEGGCFSDLTDFIDPYRAKHGCVDLLSRSRQADCRPVGSANPTLLLCCQRDMCNHVDSPEIRGLLNATYLGIHGASNPGTGRVYFGSDVWLKAATIAVPICGGFILVLLIILAVKILRKDSKRQSPPGLRGAYIQCQGAPTNQHSKTRLLLEESSPQPCDKNLAHARINFNTALPNKQNNMFPLHGNNLAGESEGAQQPLCKNIITWGNNPNSASPV